MESGRTAPEVSVVIPTYQSLEYLSDLRSTLVAQSFDRWEAVIVDNSSTDGTWEALQELQSSDARFRVHQKAHHHNPTCSRNMGLRLARGRYVAFCDSDDFWHPEKLQAQWLAFQDFSEAAIVFTQRKVWRSAGLPDEFPEVESVSAERADPRQVLYRRNLITNASAMVPKRLVEQVGYLDESLLGVDDYDLYLRLSLLGSVVSVPSELTYYRVHDDNLSRDRQVMADNLLKLAHRSRETGRLPPKLSAGLYRQAYKSLAVASVVRCDPRALAYALRSLKSSWQAFGR